MSPSRGISVGARTSNGGDVSSQSLRLEGDYAGAPHAVSPLTADNIQDIVQLTSFRFGSAADDLDGLGTVRFASGRRGGRTTHVPPRYLPARLQTPVVFTRPVSASMTHSPLSPDMAVYGAWALSNGEEWERQRRGSLSSMASFGSNANPSHASSRPYARRPSAASSTFSRNTGFAETKGTTLGTSELGSELTSVRVVKLPYVSSHDVQEGFSQLDDLNSGDSDIDKTQSAFVANPSPPVPPSSVSPSKSTTKPKATLLFLLSPLTFRDFIVLILPATALSLFAGVLSPLMTLVLGNAFNDFVAFPSSSTLASVSPEQLQVDKDRLMTSVTSTALKLVVLAALTLLSSTTMISLWICVGEMVSQRLKAEVYTSIAEKGLNWFDCGMGLGPAVKKGDGEDCDASIGAGGLMAKFARDTDDVRVACSQNLGLFVQYLTTFFTCLVLALSQSWSLTLIILCSVPLVVLVTAITERMAYPLIFRERQASALASGRIERALNAIPTVKAFTAEQLENDAVKRLLEISSKAYLKVSAVWAARLGVTQFALYATFVQGFWFGNHLVGTGSINGGKVMTVFWASLLASAHLQLILPLLTTLEKGKAAMTNLHELMSSRPPSASPSDSDAHQTFATVPLSQSFMGRRGSATAIPMPLADIPSSPPLSSMTSMSTQKRRPSHASNMAPVRSVAPLRKIRPEGRCKGEFTLTNVSFAYPSRPTVPVLRNVDMFLPCGETTYIAGESGSGKSTIVQLLLRLYEPTHGSIQLDDQSLEHLDYDWMREQVAAVQQNCVVFDISVHDNVALGLAGTGAVSAAERWRPRHVSRDDVVMACQMALLHDFVRDLPDGYDTKLGDKGAALSGGQKQRLAIARARLRDPAVLILDEATSALDTTSRLLVHEAIKKWRQNKTTIVITHDLTQIGAEDFVYLLADGRVVEHGYRSVLETCDGGAFSTMIQRQLMDEDERSDSANGESDATPTDFGDNLGSDIIEELQGEQDQECSQPINRLSHRLTVFPMSIQNQNWYGFRPKSLFPAKFTAFTDVNVTAIEKTGRLAHDRRWPSHGQFVVAGPPNRVGKGPIRRKWTAEELRGAAESRISIGRNSISPQGLKIRSTEQDVDISLWDLCRLVWRNTPKRVLLFLGMLLSVINGAITPVFSFMLSNLMSQMATRSSSSDSSAVLHYSLIILGLAFLDGVTASAKYYLMEYSADGWVQSMRTRSFRLLLVQTKSFFDQKSAAGLVNTVVKDADDARDILGQITGQMLVVVTMIGLGLGWALVAGWQLTLVGCAIAPVFILSTTVQARVVNRLEGRNKRKREAVTKQFYDMVSNIRAIRAMALEHVFVGKFEDALRAAHACGVRAAPLSGVGYGLSNAMTYLAEALMYWVGALLIVRGTYTFPRMLEVFSLIIFAVTFAAQILSYLPRLSNAKRAAADMSQLLALSPNTEESKGDLRYHFRGEVVFHNVSFAYPSRPGVPVLQRATFSIRPGEFVAVVGASGCGKSTIACLLQRLYEPAEGFITLDGCDLGALDVKWLRHHIAVVSQHPALFDMSVSENIAYGSDKIAMNEVATAAKAANVHEFIESLPDGYDTNLGDNAVLVSGGQAQRLQIARALVRNAKLLILDECTSALDNQNQKVVLDTILKVKDGRTTVMITHKLDAMKICDRILLVHDGRVVEEGRFDELMTRRGAFFQLASGGEWAD